MLKAPALFFPTYTVFIDDDLLYPRIITRDIPDCPPILSTSDFDFLLKQKDNDFLFLNNAPNKSATDIFSAVVSDIKSKTCSLSDLISTIIIDFNMDGINGLEILNQIKSPFVYKVLISNYIGPEHEDRVKHAQNTGVVDEVIEKGKHLIETLPKTIYRGQTKFFTRLSSQIFNGRNNHQYLADSNVASRFLEIINRCEPHTMWPESDLASFTLVPKEAPPSRIYFTTQSEIDALIACYDPHQIPSHTLKRLRHGDHIVCHKNPSTLDIEEWPYFLRPALKIDGAHETVLYQITVEDDI